MVKSMGKTLMWVVVGAFMLIGTWGRCQRDIARHEMHAQSNNINLIEPQLREGDVIFQTSKAEQGEALAQATHSPYTHCGILYRDEKGDWVVYEAAQPVGLQALHDWIRRGKDHHFWVRRLRDAEITLTPAGIQRLRQAGTPFQGRGEDSCFSWTDDQVYSSELVWKMYKQATGRELGKLQALRDFDLTNSPLLQRRLIQRYGNHFPMEEPVISPAQLFDSPELVSVVSR